MKISCNIIRDLLPLYVDNVLSEESTELVEAHIQECEMCKSYKESLCCEMVNVELVANENFDKERQDIAILKLIKRRIKRRNIKAAIITAIALLLSFFYIEFGILHNDSYKSYEDAGIKMTADGVMYIENAYYSYIGYESESGTYFFYLTDTVVSKHSKLTDEEKKRGIDYTVSSGKVLLDDGSYIDSYINEVYYLSEEFASDIENRSKIVNIDESKIAEMKQKSTLLWKRN